MRECWGCNLFILVIGLITLDTYWYAAYVCFINKRIWGFAYFYVQQYMSRKGRLVYCLFYIVFWNVSSSFCFLVTVQSIPLFETAFTRCTIILISSYIWLRRSGQPILGLTNIRHLLISRAVLGYLSLMSFIYW